MSKIIVFGDIHGERKLLDWHKFKPEKYHYVFLGDYIDRGPDSKGVLDFLIDLKEKFPSSVTCLKGNHEEMMLEAAKYISERKFWLKFGGDRTLQSFATNELGEIPKRYWDFIYSLQDYHETDDYIFSHASYDPQEHPQDWSANTYRWNTPTDYTPHYSGKWVILGHTRLVKPHVREKVVHIDTGAGLGGGLTALTLPSGVYTIYHGSNIMEVGSLEGFGAGEE